MNPIDRQLDLEKQMAALGVKRYRKNQERTPEAELPPGKTLMRRTLPALADAIAQFIERVEKGKAGRHHSAYPLLRDVDPNVLAYITLRCVLTTMATTPKMQAMYLTVGFAVKDHLRMAEFLATEPGLYKHTEHKLDRSNHEGYRQTILRRALNLTDVTGPEWTQGDCLRVGEKLLDLLAECSNLIESRTDRKGSRTVSYFQPTDEAMKWLTAAHERCELWEPLAMPMLIEPEPWSNPMIGGHLTLRRPMILGIRRRFDSDQLMDELFNADMPEVYDSLNKIQDVGWRINRPVLALMQSVWDSGGKLGGLPPRDNQPVPPKPWGDREPTEDELREWKAEAAIVHDENHRNISKRLAMQEKLHLAEKFADEKAIWFPYRLDFRGRVYPSAGVLSPQGDDTSKALLQFANGERLGEDGAYWLAVHIANLFGEDKMSLDDRVRWTMDNEDNIIACAASPLEYDWWTYADYPWMALAAIFEYAGFLVEGEDYVSHLPVALDGSCSGLQHFAAMMRHEPSAAAVNLTPSPTPHDVYSEVSDRVEQKLLGIVDPEDAKWASLWQGKVTRRLVKRPCMTYAYSVTRFGVVDQLMDELRKIDSELPAPYLGENGTNHNAARFLAPLLLESIQEVVTSAARAMDWLRTMCKVAINDELSLRWWAPTGLPIVQPYRDWRSKKYTVHFRGRKIQLKLAYDTEAINIRRQVNSVAPNFVHSMDAAHLMRTVLRCGDEGIESLAVIHDSFGTHAGKTSELFHLLRDEFIRLYQDDALADLHEQIAAHLPDELRAELPEPPKRGDFDLSVILDAEYCFA